MVEKLTEARKARTMALHQTAAAGIAVGGKPDIEPVRPAVFTTDITIVGDLRSMREPGWETAQQVRIQAAAGYKTALVHVPSNDTGTWHFINPEIQECVRERLAEPIDPAVTLIQSALLVIRQPHVFLEGIGQSADTPIPRILTRSTLAIADHATLLAETSVLEARNRLLKNLFGQVRWTASSSPLLAKLRANAPSLTIENEPWPNSLDLSAADGRKALRDSFVVGRVCNDQESDWPQDPELVELIYPTNDTVRFRVLSLPKLRTMPLPAPPDNWDLFRAGEISWQKFLRDLDFFVYYPSQLRIEVPATAIHWAMGHGVVTILPPDLESQIGQGPLYLPPERAWAEVRRLNRDRSEYDAISARVRDRMRVEHQPGFLEARLEQLVGHKPPAARPRPRKSHRVLFMSSNGVGVGHLTRLLAIARRMPSNIEPVVATMSQAASIVEQCGYPGEFIPSQFQTHSDNASWNAWLTEHLEHLFRCYGIRHVVFDGNHAYSGLIKAVANRSDRRLVWVRRGMWRPGQAHEPFIRRQKFFDLILEPDEIASARDIGATTYHRDRVVTIPPIRFLDFEELLPREKAAAKIGVDPARPAVLVQLGSGANRDIVSLVDQILVSAARFPELQVVVAEWLMSHNSFSFWPEIKRLRGFPLSRYFSAFDFTITAAGYNSFNEVMSFGLPAIFSANTHASMDDQSARAAYAVEHGAGFSWKTPDRNSLDQLLDALMDDDVRGTVRANALRIARPNGATDAASAICSLVDEASLG